MAELIETRGLTKIFKVGEVTVNALWDVTLTIERGSFLAIMGQSGSGKSTLMNLLGCPDRPVLRTVVVGWRSGGRTRSRSTGGDPQSEDRLRFPEFQSSAAHECHEPANP
jgi:ABC-type nitrate/sulfonate/bicarbonate transport system ATPase subunit